MGTICLGFVNMVPEHFLRLLQEMDSHGGFSLTDYDVMERSCNTFTFELAKRLELSEKYPMAILKQSKMGEFLAPMVHALGVLGDFSGSGLNVSEEDNETQPAPSCFRKRQNSASSMKTSKSLTLDSADTVNHHKNRRSSLFFNLFTFGQTGKCHSEEDCCGCKKVPEIANLDDI